MKTARGARIGIRCFPKRSSPNCGTITGNPEGECFGLARLKNVLDANTKIPLSELKSAVLKILYQHTKKELTHDDITMIALEIGPKANALRKEEPMIP